MVSRLKTIIKNSKNFNSFLYCEWLLIMMPMISLGYMYVTAGRSFIEKIYSDPVLTIQIISSGVMLFSYKLLKDMRKEMLIKEIGYKIPLLIMFITQILLFNIIVASLLYIGLYKKYKLQVFSFKEKVIHLKYVLSSFLLLLVSLFTLFIRLRLNTL